VRQKKKEEYIFCEHINCRYIFLDFIFFPITQTSGNEVTSIFSVSISCKYLFLDFIFFPITATDANKPTLHIRVQSQLSIIITSDRRQYQNHTAINS